ncbi:MAG: acyl-CoA thioesterase [Proteobacteria bacterium]|nr:acyl-CoA thioesterase [Cystobacterineae bacterium]MCL2258444.1 acyl-CoA thioesterase [Cystobacterineae bacterium]MCL2315237.1 acyl-CoA thioesterase [Pseudomonadota bacterium]
MIEVSIRVIYGDTDQMGVVYYANHFRYFEYARGELFRSLGGSYALMEEEGYMLPVVEAQCCYRAPARYDDLLKLKVWVAEIKRASIIFCYELRREGEGVLLATGKTVHVCISKEGRAVRLPDSAIRFFQQQSADIKETEAHG